MLEISDLRFRYGKRSPPVLDGLDLSLRDGEIGVVLGRPWSGWTALLAQAPAGKEPCPPASPLGRNPHSNPMSKLP